MKQVIEIHFLALQNKSEKNRLCKNTVQLPKFKNQKYFLQNNLVH